MENVKRIILVLSGKGGVGKTTVAVNIASFLKQSGYDVGLLDVDISGPNVPKMMGVEGLRPEKVDNKINPIVSESGVKIMSLGFMIDDKSSVIWRGPIKHGIIKQFSEDVNWGPLDYLIVDFPPGTGDEQISTLELLKDVYGAIVVSTPQKVSIIDSVRSIDFCKKFNVDVLGMVENMSGDVFGRGTIESVAKENGVPFLGSISMRAEIAKSGDEGKPFVLSGDSKEFEEIVKKITSK